MEFVNQTPFVADWTLGFERDGREILIVAAKGTFAIPADGQASLSPEQLPLTKSDEFTGEPGLSAPLYETDYSHLKPYCDVVLNGNAYAPGRRPTPRVTVGLSVDGVMSKSFDVVGERQWRATAFGTKVSEPEAFTQMPISYDRAYGGTAVDPAKPDHVLTYLPNPVGRGYYPLTKELDGKPLPTTQERGRDATEVAGDYRPMWSGFIGRSWPPRVRFAGTYDKEWLDEQAPFWPDDFDYRYFQSTPANQQIPYPQGDEEITLLNLAPEGLTRFRVPKESVPILLIPYQGEDRWVDGVIDTMLIEPDQGRVALTWRAILPLKKDVFEVREVVVGKLPRQRRQELRADKVYYAGLGELVKARKARGY